MIDRQKPDVNLDHEGVSCPTALWSTSSSASCTSELGSLQTLFSSRVYTSTPPSLVLSTYTIQVTVLCIDIQGFTAACAAMSASRVGMWVVDFYTRVRAVAAKHGVSTVEARGDSCVCVAGAEGAIPSRTMTSAAADPQHDQATRILAFAAALHDNLRTLSAGVNTATATRMGIATGEASFLVSTAGAGAHFISVQGEALGAATRMEALAGSGAVFVHRSTAHKWAAEARRPPPPSVGVECAGWGLQRAAVFDCATRAFLPVAAGGGGGGGDAGARTASQGSSRRAAGQSELRRSASAP